MAAVWWDGDAVGYIDQRRLPHEIVRARATGADDVVDAIAKLAVRGAPCIGIFGAYGVALAGQQLEDPEAFTRVAARIRAARPTAVNLAWAVDRVLAAPTGDRLAEARAIHAEQEAIDRAIADHGAALLPATGAVLTHCNTGPLATGAGGTALGAIIAAHRLGKPLHVFVGETRPLLQGARLTTFELAQAGVPATLIVDAAAATTMAHEPIGAVIVGADRIACNGDTANKIGTLGLAILAAHYGLPFYVAAPRSTVDFSLRSGESIRIEARDPAEVRSFGAASIVPDEVSAANPAFDVTPGRLIAGIVTEYGVARPPYDESIPDLATRPPFALVVHS